MTTIRKAAAELAAKFAALPIASLPSSWLLGSSAHRLLDAIVGSLQ